MPKPPLQRGYPVMVRVRRIIPNMLLMPAVQFRHPVAVFIHVKTNILRRTPPDWNFMGFIVLFYAHSFARTSISGNGSSAPLRLRKMLHSIVQYQLEANKKERRKWKRVTKQRLQFWCRPYFSR